MSEVTLLEAKQRLEELVSNLPTSGEVIITDGNQPVARLASVARGPSLRDFKGRSLGGRLRPYPDPEDDLLAEMREDKLRKE